MNLRFKSIRSELAVLSSLTIGLLLVVIFIFTIKSVTQKTEEDIEDGLKATLQLEIQKMEGFFESRGRVVETLLANPQLIAWLDKQVERGVDLSGDLEYQNILEILKNITKKDDSIKATFFGTAITAEYVDDTGRFENAEYYATKRPWWASAVKADKLFVTPPEVDLIDGSVVSTIKQTVYNKKGKLIAVAGVDILLSTLKQEVQSKLKYHGHGDAFVINNDGSIIFFPVDLETAAKIKTLPDVDQAVKGADGFSELSKIVLDSKSGVENVEWNGEDHIVGYERIELDYPYVDWVAGVIVPSTIKSSAINKAILMAATQVAGILITLVLIILFIARRITKPLNKLVVAMEDIAQGEGDLTIRLDDSQANELGLLARWFNLFIEKIQIVIKELSGNAEKLNQSAHELSDISGSMFSGIETASNKANDVSGSSDTMSQNMSSVATAMEEAAMNVGMVASATDEMTSTIEEIAQNTENARNITEEAVSQSENASIEVKKLGAAAEEIGNVVEAITEISEQVNLLALNATIEAARAGDAGKGFAVVAGEIKDLAQQTANATGEIKLKVSSIQSSTNSTVTEIGSISEVVNRVNSIVTTIATAIEEQSVTTREIATNVSNVAMGISEINENAAQSNVVASQIAEEISEVTSATEDLSGRSKEVNNSAEDLSQYSESLNDIVRRFKI